MKAVRVVAALFRRNREILVQQREPGGPRGLLWEFPGGKVEPGETDAQALRRECREELAVDVSVGAQVAISRHAYPDLEVEIALYQADILGGELQRLSAHDLRWVAIEDLNQLPFLPADVPLLDEVRKSFAR